MKYLIYEDVTVTRCFEIEANSQEEAVTKFVEEGGKFIEEEIAFNCDGGEIVDVFKKEELK